MKNLFIITCMLLSIKQFVGCKSNEKLYGYFDNTACFIKCTSKGVELKECYTKDYLYPHAYWVGGGNNPNNILKKLLIRKKTIGIFDLPCAHRYVYDRSLNESIRNLKKIIPKTNVEILNEEGFVYTSKKKNLITNEIKTLLFYTIEGFYKYVTMIPKNAKRRLYAYHNNKYELISTFVGSISLNGSVNGPFILVTSYYKNKLFIVNVKIKIKKILFALNYNGQRPYVIGTLNDYESLLHFKNKLYCFNHVTGIYKTIAIVPSEIFFFINNHYKRSYKIASSKEKKLISLIGVYRKPLRIFLYVFVFKKNNSMPKIFTLDLKGKYPYFMYSLDPPFYFSKSNEIKGRK